MAFSWFILALVNMDPVDEVITVSAEHYAQRHRPDGAVVTVLPDRRERYLSILN